jgi:hypothetical protein
VSAAGNACLTPFIACSLHPQAAQEATNPSKKTAIDDEDLDPSQYKANREAQIKSIESAGGNPYPHKFVVSHRLPDFEAEFDPITEPGTKIDDGGRPYPIDSGAGQASLL